MEQWETDALLKLLEAGWDRFSVNSGHDSIEELLAACHGGGIRIEKCEDSTIMPFSGLCMLYERHPEIVYVRGGRLADDAMTCAIVGCRKASGHGARIATDAARLMVSAGITVVSGLAKGIDSAAHSGAIGGVSGVRGPSKQGATVAVIPSGLDWRTIYPRESRDLAKCIVRNNGLLVSEYGPGKAVGRNYSVFFERNSLIMALSEFCIAIEAAKGSSGTLHACTEALKQSKNVYIYKPDRRVDGFQYDETGALFQDVKFRDGNGGRVRTFSSPDHLLEMVLERQVEPSLN